MQISSQKSKSVSLRPKNEKKIITVSFFVREICLLEIGGRSRANSVGSVEFQFSQKYSLHGAQIMLVAKLTLLALLQVPSELHTINI